MTIRLRRLAISRRLLFLGVGSLVLLEVASLLVVNRGRWQAGKPSYSWSNVQSGFWRDIDPHFGLWHVPLSRYRHVKNCFDVTYVANDYGARDVERTAKGEGRRFVVLGDSFVEGFGLGRSDRFASRLETSTGIEHLNFGASGLGPLQYALLYKHLASRFGHTDVMVMLYPANDFSDNSVEFGRIYFRDRYRPYFERNGKGFEIIYFRPSLNDTGPAAAASLVRRMTYEFTATFHVLDEARWRIIRLAEKLFPPRWAGRANGGNGYDYWSRPTYSGFQDYSADDFEKLVLSLDMIVNEASGRQVHLVLAPGLMDLQRYASNGHSRLGEDLREWARDRPVQLIDLLPRLHARLSRGPMAAKQLFLPCDSHWNSTGHEMVADEILQAIDYQGAASSDETAASEMW